MSLSEEDLAEGIRDLMNSTQLEPLSPKEAIEDYLEHRHDLRPQTLDTYERKLDHFYTFCEIHDIDSTTDLNGRHVIKFQNYRRTKSVDRDEPLSPKTMRDDMYLFRELLEYLSDIDAVPSDLAEKVDIPDLDKNAGVRDIDISPERVERIIEYLECYEYASRAHVVWVFHSHTGRRPGCLYALDLEDLHLDRDDPYIEFKHRPGETELKNDEDGEGEIYLSDEVANVFRDYIEDNRPDVTTERGRQPFLASHQGRLSKSTMRKYVYKYSRPCVTTGDCPHDRDVSSCDAAQSVSCASQCPSSKPPYALRHGYITAKRNESIPIEAISGRCDVSPEVIKKHYDERGESEKRKLRQQLLEEEGRDNNSRGGFQ